MALKTEKTYQQTLQYVSKNHQPKNKLYYLFYYIRKSDNAVVIPLDKIASTAFVT